MDKITKYAVIIFSSLAFALFVLIAVSSLMDKKRSAGINQKIYDEMLEEENVASGLTNRQSMIVVEALGLMKAGKGIEEVTEELRKEYDDEDIVAALMYIANDLAEGAKQ